MAAQTPVYGIKYPVAGEPIRTTRQILEDNAKAVEAAMIRGGIAPPAAQDLATLAGRVSTLEAGPDSGWTNVPYNAPMALGSQGFAVRSVGRTVDLIMDMAWAGVYGAGFTFGQIPAGFRPPRLRPVVGTYYDGTAAYIQVKTTGEVSIVNSSGASRNGILCSATWTK